MRNIRLTIEYDGTDFSGWSIQPGKRTVQGTIENSIKELTGSEHRLYAASRTDAGVHAEGQAANFLTASRMPADRMAKCLSRHLPRDVVVRKAEYVPRSFNSRRDAKGKTYVYTISLQFPAPAHVRRFVWEVQYRLDLAKMKSAAKQLLGRHDFSSFAKTDKRRKNVDPFREISSVRFRRLHIKDLFGRLAGASNGEVIVIEFEGKSFLYKMVRSMVGTLVDVGRGKVKPSSIVDILMSGKRAKAGYTAPASGLCLKKVHF